MHRHRNPNSDIYQETGDRHGEGKALNYLGRTLAEARRLDDAINACTNAAAIFREICDQDSAAQALRDIVTIQALRQA